ncbi:ParA family protein [Huintestinicola sp.]
MSKVIAVTNQKGGVGKTTTCAAFAGIFRKNGKSVLAVDLDPQGNLSFSLGAEDTGFTVHDVMKGKCSLEAAVKHTDICDVLTSNILLSGTELELDGRDREFVLKRALEQAQSKYDAIIIDTPPALSILTINAYTAADDLIIPMTPEVLSLQGISQVKDTILAVKKYYNKGLDVRGILLTRYSSKYLLSEEVAEMAEIIADQLGTKIFDTRISACIAAAEAPAHQQTIVEYSPKCRAAREYTKLARELYPELAGGI